MNAGKRTPGLPLPWEYSGHIESYPIRDAGGNGVNTTEAANAAFIVRAANAHDGLVEALKAAQDALLGALPHADRIRDILMPVIEQARAALALARGVE